MPPPSSTSRLAFRELTLADLDDMAALLGDPEVMTFYDHPKTRDESREWIEWNRRLYGERGFGLWRLALRDDAFVGDCGLTPQLVDGVEELEVGYHVRRALQGRGYATEAARGCLDLARDVVGARRLIALIDPANVASRRVAEKVGLRYEKDSLRPSGRLLQVYAVALRPPD
jgi:RimJ/RimL family protein N-acetyltransferase